jgi:hypothetical protein
MAVASIRPTDSLRRRHHLRARAGLAIGALAAVIGSLSQPMAASALRDGGSSGGGVLQATPPRVSDYYPLAYDPQLILPAAQVNQAAGTVTLPLYQGRMRDGRSVWYVLTDVSDQRLARQLGLNWSPKLANAPDGAVRTATRNRQGSLVFDQGWVDFSPERVVLPGAAPNYFPPAQARAGSVGDAAYSPLVRVSGDDGAVFNATTVANGVSAVEIEFPNGNVDHSKVIDRAVAISPKAATVTLGLSTGTSSGRPILFVSLDSNTELVSALEATNVAPALNELPVGLNDQPDSAVSANYIIVNGPTGADNPQRQGLNSALGDAGAQVFDIFDGAPGVVNGPLYSPMWDLYVVAWTDRAIGAGYRSRLDSELAVQKMAAGGWLTAPGGGSVGASGLISNCPLILHF